MSPIKLSMKYICIWLVRLYRKFLSPLKRSSCCRFTPTCSAYAIEAFQKRGFFIGMYLTVYRIFRCNPFCAGGYDPVPERGLKPMIYREITGGETNDESKDDEAMTATSQTQCEKNERKSAHGADEN